MRISTHSFDIIMYGVPQVSILGPPLFNTFVKDIFFFVRDSKVTNYAGDNTPEDSVEKLLETRERETNILLDWFKCNEMNSNTDRCHLIIVNNHDNDIKIRKDVITSENSVTFLGVTMITSKTLMNMWIM